MKKLLLPLLALAALALPARAAIDLEAIAPDGFARGVAFTVNGYDVSRPALTNFPVLVRISEAGVHHPHEHTRPGRRSGTPFDLD